MDCNLSMTHSREQSQGGKWRLQLLKLDRKPRNAVYTDPLVMLSFTIRCLLSYVLILLMTKATYVCIDTFYDLYD